MRAALMEKPAAPPVMTDDVECASPGPGQVKVHVSHCGICHSDLTIFDLPASQTPIILGHEASGTVEAVGEGVTSLKEGDSVMLSPFAPCGRCYFCIRGDTVLCVEASSMFTGLMPDGTSPLSRGGEMVYRGLGVGGFSEYTVVGETATVKIDEDIPREVAAVMGCAIQTGVGAVLNTAKVEPGATVLVMGLGGIGASVVQGAKIAGASRIVVSDPVQSRREKAIELGATEECPPEEVADMCGQITKGTGMDYAFDAVGNTGLVANAVGIIRPGGSVVMVGAPSADQTLEIPVAVAMLTTEKKILGCLYGSSDSRREVPRLLALWRSGKLDLEGMVTHRRPLEEINEGLDDMRKQNGLRTVLQL